MRRGNATLAILVMLTLTIGGLSFAIPKFFEATSKVRKANRAKESLSTLKQGLQQYYYKRMGAAGPDEKAIEVADFPESETSDMDTLWQIIGTDKSRELRERLTYKYDPDTQSTPYVSFKIDRFEPEKRDSMKKLYAKYIPLYNKETNRAPIPPPETLIKVKQQSKSWTDLRKKMKGESSESSMAARMSYKTVTKFPDNKWDWFMGYTSKRHAEDCHLKGDWNGRYGAGGCARSDAVPRPSLLESRQFAHGHAVCGCMHKGCTSNRGNARRIKFELVDLDDYPKRNWPRREIFIRTTMDWEQFMPGPWVYNAFTNVSKSRVVPFTKVNRFMKDEKLIWAPMNWESPRYSASSAPFKLWSGSNFNIRYNSLRTAIEFDPDTNKIYFVSVLSAPYYMPWARFKEVTIAWR